jgi:preprotein translocase subunit YajC
MSPGRSARGEGRFVDKLGSLLPILLLAGAFYLLILRPARNRQSAARATQARLAPGRRVMTTAGLFGTVSEIDGDEVLLEIAPGVVVRYVAAAIARVIDDAPTAADAEPDLGTDGELESSSPGDDTPDA